MIVPRGTISRVFHPNPTTVPCETSGTAIAPPTGKDSSLRVQPLSLRTETTGYGPHRDEIEDLPIRLSAVDVPRGTIRERFTWNSPAGARKFKIRECLFRSSPFEGGLDLSIAYQKEPPQ